LVAVTSHLAQTSHPVPRFPPPPTWLCTIPGTPLVPAMAAALEKLTTHRPRAGAELWTLARKRIQAVCAAKAATRRAQLNTVREGVLALVRAGVVKVKDENACITRYAGAARRQLLHVGGRCVTRGLGLGLCS
jgi:hypothetical protein